MKRAARPISFNFQTLLCCCILVGCISSAYMPCNTIDPSEWQGPHKKMPHWEKKLEPSDLPGAFTWGDANGKSYLTRIRNQKTPNMCGSCWTQAVASTMSDRISILRQGAFPEISISAQLPLTCDRSNNGCRGGSHVKVLEWIKTHNITDESCSAYYAKDFNSGLMCNEQAYCQDCSGFDTCYIASNYRNYTIEDYGNIPPGDTASIMQEVYQHGPVVCGINGRNLDSFTGPGVLATDDNRGVTHAVSIIGWGETQDKVPYWIVRNSYGEEWGDRGFAKVYRGNNTLQIEQICTWLTPKNTWDNNALKVASNKTDYPSGEISNPITVEPVLLSALSDAQVPDNFFLGNVSGQNYLTMVQNQVLPNFCGSCWAFATTQAISDRINFLITKNKPKVMLSVQYALNCMNGMGSCNGGDHPSMYKLYHEIGVAESGCETYEATTPDLQICSKIQQCKTCNWFGDHVSACFDQPYKKWWISEFGPVTGIENIKREVASRGPISCSMYVSNNFLNYTGGIYSEKLPKKHNTNHVVSIVGFGKDEATGTDYWIVRNSWGTFWGEDGFFRIKMGEDNLYMETRCWFGVPSEHKVLADK